jgi:hypothetical protein
MKRLVLALACLLGLAAVALAQTPDDFPNLRQSVNYFNNFTKDSAAMAAQIRETLEAEKQAPGYPRTDNYVFYAALGERTERLIALTANLTDLYVLYNKTTYCYAKDEKNYLYARIDAIQIALQRLIDSPYVIDTTSSDGDKARMHDKLALFNQRVAQLRAFITKSLPAFKR